MNSELVRKCVAGLSSSSNCLSTSAGSAGLVNLNSIDCSWQSFVQKTWFFFDRRRRHIVIHYRRSSNETFQIQPTDFAATSEKSNGHSRGQGRNSVQLQHYGVNTSRRQRGAPCGKP